MRNNRFHSTLGSLLCILTLAAGCSSRAVVGTDVDPVDSSDCHGACPDLLYAEGVRAGWSEVFDLAVTPDGGAVIAGIFMGDLTIGGTTLQAAPFDALNSYIVKLDAAGSVVWARHVLGNFGSCAVAVRPTGEIWVAGSFEKSSIDFGFTTLTAGGEWPLFAVELLPDGTPGNAHAYDGNGWVNDLALAPNGDLVITGVVTGPTSLGSIVVAPEDPWEGAQSHFIARIGHTGDVFWANRHSVSLGKLSALPDGKLAIVGSYEGTGTLGGLSLPAEGTSSNGFIAALDASGAPVWASRLDPTPSIAGDPIAAASKTLAVTPEGKLVVAFNSASSDDPAALFDQRIHLQTFEPDGARVSHADLGDGGLDGFSLAVAPDGDILVGGGYWEALDLGSASLEAPGYKDSFLARFAPGGASLRWVKRFVTPEARQGMLDVIGTPEPESYVVRVGVAPDGRPLLAGQYMGSFTLGEVTLPSSPDNGNVFVASFAP